MTTEDAGELLRLRGCIRDLVALSSVRAWWVGRPPVALAESLRDFLLSMLTVDTVHVELHDSDTHESYVSSGGLPDATGREDGAVCFASYSVGSEGELGRLTVSSSREDFPTMFESLLLRVTANEVTVALQHAALLHRHERVTRLLADRARQQAAVARLGMRALSGLGVNEILTEAVGAVREMLRVDLCEIFEFVGGDASLVLRVGDGWPVDAAGTARLTIGNGEPGSALLTTDPVIVEDVRRDERFARAPALTAHGVTSWISVMVAGPGRPYGVLGAHTTEPRLFTGDDVYFLQAVANLVAVSLERHDSEATRERLLEATARAQAGVEQATGVRSDFHGMMSHALSVSPPGTDRSSPSHRAGR